MEKFKSFLKHALFPMMALVVIVGIIVLRLIFTPVIIQTGSMEPKLPVGTIVLIKQSDDLKPGDIITFREDTAIGVTTHTFIGYADDGSLRTKGDANPEPDVHFVPLQQSAVMGEFVVGFTFLTASYWTSISGVLSLIVIGLMVISVIIILVTRNKELKPEKSSDETRELSPV